MAHALRAVPGGVQGRESRAEGPSRVGAKDAHPKRPACTTLPQEAQPRDKSRAAPCGIPDAIAVGRAPRGHGPGIWAPQQSMERPGTTFEHDDGAVTVEGVTHLRLWPQLDKGGWPCRATLTQEERR